MPNRNKAILVGIQTWDISVGSSQFNLRLTCIMYPCLRCFGVLTMSRFVGERLRYGAGQLKEDVICEGVTIVTTGAICIA